MKTYRWHLVALALLILLAHTMEYNEVSEEECFTDSCVGCIEDCLQPLKED